MMPRDPQGAETRTETYWRNVFLGPDGEWRSTRIYQFRPICDAYAEEVEKGSGGTTKRIAVEEVTTVTTITRYPIPPHAGEETKG